MASKLGDLKIYIGAATDGLEKGLSRTKSLLGGFGRSLISLPGLGTLLGGGFAAKGLLELGDSYVDLNSRLTTLLGSAYDAEEAQKALFDMSNKTRSSVLANAEAYTRLTVASDLTGLSADENVAVLGALNVAFAQSGASADEAKRAIVQLGQGLASGVLQGDELRGSVYPLLLGRATVQGIGVAHRRALQDLVRAVDWLKLQPVIDSEYALADLPAALEHLERGAFGKLVLRMR